MYVKEVIIQNIRAITELKMTFPQPAGWHVLIGDNGAGKSSAIRAIALALIGPGQMGVLRQSFMSWLRRGEQTGYIEIKIERDKLLDGEMDSKIDIDNLKDYIWLNKADIKYKDENTKIDINNGVISASHLGNGVDQYEDWGKNGWFSSGFGPFRRFSGGNPDTANIFKDYPRVAAHLSLFGEDVALAEALEWIKQLDYLRLKEKEKEGNGGDNTYIYQNLLKFINESKLLPHNTTIEGIDEQGIIFIDGNQNQVTALELSDGFRAVLSMTFELIRQLVSVYGAQKVFGEIAGGNMQISLPGVVLIDEIDAHLHPSWQTEVGLWFTQYFPALQFIVTTHSPLICRACEKGSIWRLATPGSEEEAAEITGIDKEKLIMGNILDAYGTEVFGSSPVRSEQSQEALQRLGRLNMLSALGKISPDEEKERLKLQQILSTDAPIG